MIQMENVTYSYEKGYGVKNVNFTLDDAEFAFLIGPTGSGKTTIMKLIYMLSLIHISEPTRPY